VLVCSKAAKEKAQRRSCTRAFVRAGPGNGNVSFLASAGPQAHGHT